MKQFANDNEIELNEQQEKFCYHFMLHHDGIQAAIDAGYPPDEAEAVAEDLLNNPDINRYMDLAAMNLPELMGLTKPGVLKQLKDISNNVNEDTTNRLQALKQISTIMGFDRHHRHDIFTHLSHGFDAPVQVELKLNGANEK